MWGASNMAKSIVQIVPATLEHAQALVPHVRQADIDEFYALNLSTPEEVLVSGINLSTKSWTAIFNGEVAAIFGVSPASIIGGVGIPWLVGSDILEKHQKAFLRRCKPFVGLMLQIYPELLNYVDERNYIAKAWLHWLGFKLEDAQPIGALNYPFHKFTMNARAK